MTDIDTRKLRTWATIDLDVLRANYAALEALARPVRGRPRGRAPHKDTYQNRYRHEPLRRARPR